MAVGLPSLNEITMTTEKSGKVRIALPGRGRAAIDFATDVGDAMRRANEKKNRRFCVRYGLVGEIKVYQKFGTTHLAFVPLTPAVAVTELEEIIRFVANHGVTQSITVALAKVLLASRQLKDCLPRVDRILNFTIPASHKRQRKSGAVGFTASIKPVPAGFSVCEDSLGNQVGYYCHEDQTHFVALNRVKRWWTLALKDVRALRDELRKAVNDEERLKIREKYHQRLVSRKAAFEANKDAYVILDELFEEFELSEEGKIHALARLITPYCQAMIGWLKRTPSWLFSAEGPRSGKDFMAKITPILYEGIATEDAPLDKDEAEVKRRITASVVAGTRFMHFANCKGELASSSLEGAITAEYWSDRVVGTSSVVNMPIEIIFSLSYNTNDLDGISADLKLRSREIYLMTPWDAPADPNKRIFKRVSLHDELRRPQYRRIVVAAIAALVENWRIAGCPPGPTFASFPEWANVVAGILQVAGLGDATTSPAIVASDQSGLSDRELELILLINYLADFHGGKDMEFEDIYEVVLANAPAFPFLTDLTSQKAQQPLGRYLPKMHAKSHTAKPGSACVSLVHATKRRKVWKFWRKPLDQGLEVLDL
jgi:hypothetical protein